MSSESVAAALGDKLRPGQFTVVFPSSWRQHKCNTEFRTPKGLTRYKVRRITFLGPVVLLELGMSVSHSW